MYSVDHIIFKTGLTNLELEYSAGVISSLKETWLPHQEMFVPAWTKHYLHFRTTVTFRVDSKDLSLKS
jgi:hypothetical protein